MGSKPVIVETQMLIRKPIAEVFNSFRDPEQTRHFWFTKSTGKLEQGKTVEWTWEMYGFTTSVDVKKIIENELISVVWGDPKENIDFIFKPSTDRSSTYVVVKNYGFQQTGDELISKIMDTTGGFTTVLDGMKAWLEHGLELNLVRDKFPAEFIAH